MSFSIESLCSYSRAFHSLSLVGLNCSPLLAVTLDGIKMAWLHIIEGQLWSATPMPYKCVPGHLCQGIRPHLCVFPECIAAAVNTLGKFICGLRPAVGSARNILCDVRNLGLCVEESSRLVLAAGDTCSHHRWER